MHLNLFKIIWFFFSNELVSIGNEYTIQNEKLQKNQKQIMQSQKYNKIFEIIIPCIATLDIAVNGDVIFPIWAYLITLTLIALEKQSQKIAKKHDKYYKEFMNKKEKVVSDAREQISRLKVAKEFIKSCTEEELNNYLSYKMGSSDE